MLYLPPRPRKGGKDFFSYANGAWLKRTEIPRENSRWGSFNVLRDNSLTTLLGILDRVSPLLIQRFC